MSPLKFIALSGAFIFPLGVFAVDDTPPSLNKEERNFTSTTNTPKSEALPTLPDEASDSRNIPQPEVRIIRKKDAVVEEYRVKGNLRFIKITPSVGKPYYMVDTDGDGVLETRENDLDNPPINQWILLEW